MCWVHCRQAFFEAQAAAQALEQIGALYESEEHIRQNKLAGEARWLHRMTHSKPLVEGFFEWVGDQFTRQGLLPSNPLTKALAYARERRAALQVFLADPDVPMDTNHLERALRAIPMGRRRNWLFCWTEVGAQHAGIVQSLIATCRLHGMDPYTSLVDVLTSPTSRCARTWTPRRPSLPLAPGSKPSMVLITQAVPAKAAIAVGGMGQAERAQLADEVFAHQPNLLASVLVLQRMGASLQQIDVPAHPARGVPGDEDVRHIWHERWQGRYRSA